MTTTSLPPRLLPSHQLQFWPLINGWELLGELLVIRGPFCHKALLHALRTSCRCLTHGDARWLSLMNIMVGVSVAVPFF